MKKALLALIFIITANLLIGQGLPIDRDTQRVLYKGKIEVEGLTEDQVADRLLSWFSYETMFRGQFGPAIEYIDEKIVQSTVQLNITNMVRTYIWQVNAKITLEYSADTVKYTLTDFYTFGSASFLILYPDESLEGPIEQNDHFNIRDMERTNNNAKNVDRAVKRIIELLEYALETD